MPTDPQPTSVSRRDWLLGTLGAIGLSATGCRYVATLGYLIGGPPSIEPDFDMATKKSMTDYDVTVAVVCYADNKLKYDNTHIDQEIAKYLTLRLVQHKVKVIDSDRVRAWIDAHPDWDKPEEIGEAFDVQYVIHVDLLKFNLFEENSAQLYRGRAEVVVSVIEMNEEEGTGEKIYNKELTSRYPLGAPRSSSEVTFTNFKRQYLSRLSEEVGRLFYEYYNGDDITDAL